MVDYQWVVRAGVRVIFWDVRVRKTALGSPVEQMFAKNVKYPPSMEAAPTCWKLEKCYFLRVSGIFRTPFKRVPRLAIFAQLIIYVTTKNLDEKFSAGKGFFVFVYRAKKSEKNFFV